MTIASDVPFNISLLNLNKAKLEALRPVTKLDIMEGGTTNFADDGLYSTLIFGKVGNELRNARFSYINIKVEIFHPVIYRALVGLKRIYSEIISGSTYVLWDDEISDFVRSDAINGHTGFDYFVQYWNKIKHLETKSTTREQNILLINKSLDIAMTSKVIVIPAGLRDIEITDDGRVREDEINAFYKRLISISNTISDVSVKSNPEIINKARYSLQIAFNELYDYIESMIEGKKKLLMGKWASRRIMNGTRNVITAMDASVSMLGAPGNVTVNDTHVGLYQGVKSAMPISRFHLKNEYLADIFVGVNVPTKLVNMKTLEVEEVLLDRKYFDKWNSDEGLEKVITSFREESLRHLPLVIDGRYLTLIYKGPDGTYKVFSDMKDLPPNRSKEHVTPITFCELLYLSTYKYLKNLPSFVTRYPIAGIGSIYPSFMKIKPTVKTEVRRELSDDWEPMDDDHVAGEFPTNSAFLNSISPHATKLSGLVADRRVKFLV